jgi:glucose 1-dehydrogenase
MKLKDKVALVTGASSGIGLSIVERFAAEGAHVGMNYRLGGKLDAKSAAVRAAKLGPNVLAVAGDVARRPDVEQMVQEVVAKFGRLDIVVSNAGVEIKRPFLEVTDDEWNRILSINLYGAFLISQIGARQMVKQGTGGKLIYISSIHEDVNLPDHTPYCASKGGIRMLMRNLAVDLARYKITANNIAPGFIVTPINEATLKDAAAMKEALEGIPVGRLGKPEEVAGVAAFLASAEADYVTGSTYYIDGGMVTAVAKH